MKHLHPLTPGLLALLIGALPAGAQLPYPQLRSLFPPGGQAGQSVEVTIGGSLLEECSGLLFTHPGITAEAVALPATEWRPASTAPFRFQVSVAPDVPPGFYEVHARTRLGLTAPRTFVVGSGPETVEIGNAAKTNAQPLTLGTTVNGQADPDAIDCYQLPLNAGQRVLIRCEAEALDSRMDATLALFDERGRQLLADRDTTGRDPLLVFSAPEDGTYEVRVHDFTFRGGPEYPYRLLAGTMPQIDFVIPPAGQPGTTGTFKLYGSNLPGGSLGEGVRLGGRELESVEVEITLPDTNSEELAGTSVARSLVPGMTYRLVKDGQASNPVRIGFASAPVVSAEESGEPQEITIPAEIHGRFEKAGDLDHVEFLANKESPLWIECLSDRLRPGCDPVVIVEQVTTDADGRETTKEVASSDDVGSGGDRRFPISTRDSALAFTPPADGRYRVTVINQAGRGGAAALYRLLLRTARPHVDLVTIPWPAVQPDKQANRIPALLRRGGSTALRVFVLRREGFSAELTLEAQGLPPGVTCEPVTVRPGATSATMYLYAEEQADDWDGFITLLGRHGETTTAARAGALSWPVGNWDNERARARLTTRLPLSVRTEPAPVTMAAFEKRRWEVPLNGTVEIPVKLVKHGPVKGDFTVEPAGLPYAKKRPQVKIKESDTEGKVSITFKKTNEFPIAPGEWQFVLQASGAVKHRDNVAGLDAAEAEKARLAELETRLLAQAREARSKVGPAKAAAEEAQKNLGAASPDARAPLEAKATDTKAALQAAEEGAQAAESRAKQATAEKQAAEGRAKQAADRAKVTDRRYVTHSLPLTVIVKPEPPKDEKKEGQP